MSEHENPSIHSDITIATEADDALAEIVAPPDEQSIQETIIHEEEELKSIISETQSNEIEPINDETGKEEIEAAAAAEAEGSISVEELENEEEANEEEKELDEESVNEDPTCLVEEIIHDLLIDAIKEKPPADLYTELTENDHLIAFIQDTLGALADDIELGDRVYRSHKEAYFWMTFFFLHFCGFKIFLQNIGHQDNVEQVAEIVVDLVDNVVDNADYLHYDSDIPEHVAKNIMWQILNSRMMRRRFDNRSVAQSHAEDILEDILDKVVIKEPELFSFSFATLASGESEAKVEEKEASECREYGGIFNIAEHFVCSILKRSAAKAAAAIEDSSLLQIKYDEKASEPEVSTLKGSVRLPCKLHMFPAIKDFNMKYGRDTVISIIDAWKKCYLLEDWLFSVKFIIGHSDSCSDFYTYQAKFGLPTPMYPVPQATCSLLFKIEVSRVKPSICPVNITFKVEASGFVHTVGEYEFNEDWLLNVINAKLRLFSKLQF